MLTNKSKLVYWLVRTLGYHYLLFAHLLGKLLAQLGLLTFE